MNALSTGLMLTADRHMREQIEASIDLVLAEQQAALDQRRAAAGITAAADEPRPAEAIHHAPNHENAPTAASSVTGILWPMVRRPAVGHGLMTGRLTCRHLALLSTIPVGHHGRCERPSSLTRDLASRR